MDDYAPDFEVVFGIDFEDGIGGIGGFEFDITVLAMGEVEEFNGEFSVPEGNDDGTAMGLNGSVDDDTVAVVDACILHGVSLYVSIEG